MENVIKKFLEINNSGTSSGSGSGYSSGTGSGTGSGHGDGSGTGSGYGTSDGSGSSSGYGYSGGSGCGSGNGDGSGSGSGFGTSHGTGTGSGSGDGNVYNILFQQSHLSEYKKGFLTKKIASLKTFKSKLVYYIDNIPCYFLSIVGNTAKVNVIKDDFSVEKQYICKQGNLFAHGKTRESALHSVAAKFYALLSVKEKKAEFISKFNLRQTYKMHDFYNWHHFLTGSCKSGLDDFIKTHKLYHTDNMTLLEFLELAKDNYNGAIFKEILVEYTLNKIKYKAMNYNKSQSRQFLLGAVISRFYSRLKDKSYQLWHGHPFLLNEEVEIICKTREEPKFKHFNNYEIQALVKLRIYEMYEKYKEQQKCKHAKWDFDTQIRTIECRECGKRAWIEDYRSLY